MGDFKNEEMLCRRAAPVVPEGGWAGLRARVNVRPVVRLGRDAHREDEIPAE